MRTARPRLSVHAACLLAIALFGMVQLPQGARAAPPPPGASLAPMLETVLPAVVNISTRAAPQMRRNPLLDDPFFQRFFDLPEVRPREPQFQSRGSGVIVDARQGYVLTNHHVIDDAEEITVTLRDGRSFTARLVGQDPEVDIALLRIEAGDLTALPIADSDALRVGDFVVAIGNPFGLGQTVTYGIVSALGRSGLGIEGFENFIQTDASINPGNSGGALVTTQGQLVGINTAILGPSGANIGIGFAIPSNMVQAIVRQLAEHGEVRRGELGVTIQDLTPELAAAFGLQNSGGALLSQVITGSAADQAGLAAGDIVVAVNDRPIRSGDALRNAIGLLPVGETLALDVIRNGRPLRLRATIASAGEDGADVGRLSGRLAGAMLGDLPAGPEGRGVRVIDVERGSPAWQTGLRPGDIIVAINRQALSAMADVPGALQRAPGSLQLNIRRGTAVLSIYLRD
ncbi:MAG TPA: DegQ family serine endoprotease [Gammaproteobacteria bacterium]|nr:DegQ family serine endoprotease [Gammaproteobacteria bacterium]